MAVIGRSDQYAYLASQMQMKASAWAVFRTAKTRAAWRRVQTVGAHQAERDLVPMAGWGEGSWTVRPEERDRSLLGRQRPRDVVNLANLGLEDGLARTRRPRRPERHRIVDVPGQHPSPAGQEWGQKTGRGRHPELRADGNRAGERRVRAVALGPRDELFTCTAPKSESSPGARARRGMHGAVGEVAEVAPSVGKEVRKHG
jgi:hypothetical protein